MALSPTTPHPCPLCYVCGRAIHSEPVRVPGPPEQAPIYRHQRCAPGTDRYMANRKLARAYRAEFKYPTPAEHFATLD